MVPSYHDPLIFHIIPQHYSLTILVLQTQRLLYRSDCDIDIDLNVTLSHTWYHNVGQRE